MDEATTTTNGRASVFVEDGVCHVLFAYDVSTAIDLDLAERVLSMGSPRGGGATGVAGVGVSGGVSVVGAGLQRETIPHHRRAPSHLQFRPLPLRVDHQGEPISIRAVMRGTGAVLGMTEPRVECTMYDFGAVSVQYRISFNGEIDGLLALSAALYENAELLADSRRRVDALVSEMYGALLRPEPCTLVEDYVIYHARLLREGARGGPELLKDERVSISQVLRAEQARLSGQEADDAICCAISYSERDLVVVDWCAAFVFDANAEDILAVLEYANVELLELRFLDDRLDAVLDRLYTSVLKRTGARKPGRFIYGTDPDDRRRIATMQMDAALLFESVNNTLKLVGDQYLARLYRLTAQRFHLTDWDASIQRKLATLEGIYDKINDEQSARRMELLEIVIIVLFVVSIVLPFLVK